MGNTTKTSPEADTKLMSYIRPETRRWITIECAKQDLNLQDFVEHLGTRLMKLEKEKPRLYAQAVGS